MLNALIIAHGRGWTNSDYIESRYVCIGVTVWIACVGLAGFVIGRHRLSAVPVAGLAIVAVLGSTAVIDTVRKGDLAQRELANAQALHVSDGSTAGEGWNFPWPAIDSRLGHAGHYPHDGRWSNGCGIDDVVPESEVVEDLGRDIDARALPGYADFLPSGTYIIGWAARGDDVVDCVLVIDRDNRIVGVGTWGWNRDDYEQRRGISGDGFRAVARPDLDEPRVIVRFEGSDEFFVVPMVD